MYGDISVALSFISDLNNSQVYDVARLNASDIVATALSALGQAGPVKEPKLA